MLGCYLTEQLFLVSDGVFHLMDLLEVITSNLICQLIAKVMGIS